MSVCVYVLEKLEQYWIDWDEIWHVGVEFYGGLLYLFRILIACVLFRRGAKKNPFLHIGIDVNYVNYVTKRRWRQITLSYNILHFTYIFFIYCTLVYINFLRILCLFAFVIDIFTTTSITLCIYLNNNIFTLGLVFHI